MYIAHNFLNVTLCSSELQSFISQSRFLTLHHNTSNYVLSVHMQGLSPCWRPAGGWRRWGSTGTRRGGWRTGPSDAACENLHICGAGRVRGRTPPPPPARELHHSSWLLSHIKPVRQARDTPSTQALFGQSNFIMIHNAHLILTIITSWSEPACQECVRLWIS